MQRRFALWASWMVLLLYVVVIFYLSTRPKAITPLYFPGWDKVAHLIEYGILGFLSQQAARVTWPRGWGGRWPVGPGRRILLRMSIVLFAGICIGALDEMIQAGIFWERSTERIASVTDFGADSAGLVLGMLLNIRRYRSGSVSEAEKLKETTP